ncbi:DUF932 domain-containing protein [Algibacter lectus]|nr:DUF932 domain-containing protein [Algibacter lectus]
MYLNKLKQDDVFVSSEIKPLETLTLMESRRGLENAIVSNGKIVNVVSKCYAHITNQLFFGKAEQMLIDADLAYHRQTINRNDRTFCMDFIIEDKARFKFKNENDLILPMLRFTNSYDGRNKTSGHFGFYRQVCSNGLHVSESKLEFSIKRTHKGMQLLMPKLKQLFDKFIDNEFYSVIHKFDVLNEVKIIDTAKFVKDILEKTKLFRYECSDANPDPSKRSREVIDILNNEALALNQEPTLWLGYNAFNSVLHNSIKKSFSRQKKLDKVLFNEIYEMA